MAGFHPLMLGMHGLMHRLICAAQQPRGGHISAAVRGDHPMLEPACLLVSLNMSMGDG